MRNAVKVIIHDDQTLRIGRKTKERMHPYFGNPAMTAAKIQMVGHSLVPEGEFSVRRLNPDFQQILVVVSGKGRVCFGGKWRELRPGEAFLSTPHESHEYEAAGMWEFVWSMFRGDAFPEFSGTPLIRKANAALWSHVIIGFLEELAEPVSSRETTEHWISLLKLESRKLIEGEKKHQLAPLWSHVKGNLSQRWTLDLLAQKAGVNIETLRLVCQRDHGMSPAAYLAQLRMNHAAGMLSSGMKVEYVAYTVGYDTPSNFSTAFHRVIGVSPSSLKKSKSKNS